MVSMELISVSSILPVNPFQTASHVSPPTISPALYTSLGKNDFCSSKNSSSAPNSLSNVADYSCFSPIDHEYPNSQGIGCNSIRDTDSANYLKFLKILRREIGPNKLVTAAVATSPFNGPDGNPLEDVSEFAKYFDYLNLMSYDISGSWSPTTGPLAPLRSCGADSSVEAGIKAWVDAGFPAEKIFAGVPSYATSWTTESSKLALTKTELTSPYGGSQLFQNYTSIPKGNAEDVVPTTDECGVVADTYSGAWKYYELVNEGVSEISSFVPYV
jgi:chitinase